MTRRGVALAIVVALLVSRAGAAEAVPAPVSIDVLLRLKGTSLESSPAVQAALKRALEQTRKTPQFLELVRAFDLKDQTQGLIELAAALPTDSTGVEALQKVLDDGGLDKVRQALKGADGPRLIQALGSVTNDEGRALAQAASGKEPAAGTTPTAAASAQASLESLLARSADASRGEKVFFGDAGCAACHRVRDRGVDFGPDLSTIGDKYAKEAMFANIVDPSAGIGFGFEPWQIKLKAGSTVGLIVSESDDEIAVKSLGGIVIRYSKSDVVSRTQLPTSLMPVGLLQALGPQDAADLLEYLVRLRKT